MRVGSLAAGMALVAAGFAAFFVLLEGFGVPTAPAFAVAGVGAVVVAGGALAGSPLASALGAATVALVFAWLQVTRPAFTLTLGTLGNVLIAAGAAVAAFGHLRAQRSPRASWGWLVAAAGGLAFLPGNLDAGASFVAAGLLATAGFAVAAWRAWEMEDAQAVPAM